MKSSDLIGDEYIAPQRLTALRGTRNIKGIINRINNINTMKKLFYCAAALIVLLFGSSCQQEKLEPAGEQTLVTLEVEIPYLAQTKAISKAELTDIVYYEIWRTGGTEKLFASSAVVTDCKASIQISLVKGLTYDFIFWAQNKDCGAYDVTELKTVKVKYDVIAAAGNQDKFDAFYAFRSYTVEVPFYKTVKLERPFAQLNFGATKMTTTLGDIKLGDTQVTVSPGLPTIFNTVEGKGETPTANPVTFKAKGLATSAEKLEVDIDKNGSISEEQKFIWVSMNYMLRSDESTYTVTTDFSVEGVGSVRHSVSNVPLKANYRTNILGDLFTSDARLNIVVEPDFKKPDEVKDAI